MGSVCYNEHVAIQMGHFPTGNQSLGMSLHFCGVRHLDFVNERPKIPVLVNWCRVPHQCAILAPLSSIAEI